MLKRVRPPRLAPRLNANSMTRRASQHLVCDLEATERRRELAEILAAEVVADVGSRTESYEIEWCIAAMESASGDPFKAREWLQNWAPKKGETYMNSS